MSEEIGFEIHLASGYEKALESVIAALKSEGFGVLTRIDVRATLKEKLGEERANREFNKYIRFHLSDHRLLWMQFDTTG